MDAIISFNLLKEAHRELGNTLGSVAKNWPEQLLGRYRAYLARHIYNATDGYIALRELGRMEASRLLIRPVIEAMFRLLAVQNDPRNLYRIARYEHREDEKWARPAAKMQGQNINLELDQRWQEIAALFHKEFPDETLNEDPLSVRGAAEIAGIVAYYDSHYRLYCQFTHASFRATVGDLSDFKHEDDRTVIFCVLMGVGAAVSAGGTTSKLQELWERLTSEPRAPSEADGPG